MLKINEDSSAIMTDEDKIECAWCLARAGIIPTEGSHGICKEDAAAMLAQAALRHLERTPSYVERFRGGK